MSRRARKNRIAQLRSRKTFRRNVVQVALRLLAWGGAAVLYYVVLSLLFDTPYEYYLKYSSQRLHAEYEALQSRYDSLNMVITNIEERDHNIFNTMFDSSPYELDHERRSNRIEIYEATNNQSTEQLLELFQSRFEGLESSVERVVESNTAMRDNIVAAGSAKCAKIPAIQPIVNRQFTLLTASYGVRLNPFYKVMQPHLGVDYTIPEGTRVFATADGVIKSYSLSSSASGKSVVIDHGNGYESYYAHLGKIDIPRSRRVKRGDIIGTSGNTGLSLTPHLHYEVRYQGESVDPIEYFFMELTPTQMQRMRGIAERGMQAFD